MTATVARRLEREHSVQMYSSQVKICAGSCRAYGIYSIQDPTHISHLIGYARSSTCPRWGAVLLMW